MDINQEIMQAKATLNYLVVTDWLYTDLFSARWFGTVAAIIFSYVLVFSLLDKRRITQTLLFGSFMTVMVSVLDIFGVQFGLWSFLTRIFPIIPSLFFFDFTIIPLYYMLVHQYSPNWKTFIFWNAVIAGILSFGFFPALTALEMFQLNRWSYLYFFPILFIFGLIARAVLLGLLALEEKQRENRMASQYRTNWISQPIMKSLYSKRKNEKP